MQTHLDKLREATGRADLDGKGSLRVSLYFDMTLGDSHHAIIKPGDARHVVASRLRELADRIMEGCREHP